jgi:hypothetical protein
MRAGAGVDQSRRWSARFSVVGRGYATPRLPKKHRLQIGSVLYPGRVGQQEVGSIPVVARILALPQRLESIMMTIKPKPSIYLCPSCGWRTLVSPKSDVIRAGEHPKACPVCACLTLLHREPRPFERVLRLISLSFR